MLYNIIERRALGRAQSHLGGRVPEVADKIAVYRVKVFLLVFPCPWLFLESLQLGH